MTTPRTTRADSAHQTAQADALRETVIAELGERRRASGGAGVMRWCVASLADGDTHLAEPGEPGLAVTAHCDGRQFCALAILPGAPPDQEQICPVCRAGQPSPTTQTHRTTPDKVTT